MVIFMMIYIAFRLKLLVCTDVAARGLDIKGVTLVVNYDAPSNTEEELFSTCFHVFTYFLMVFQWFSMVFSKDFDDILNGFPFNLWQRLRFCFSRWQDYVHRIGRTGRAGQKGHAVTLIVERDAHALRGIVEA